MIDNPHLAGIPPPPKCGNCPDHPRLLPDGSCIFCGTERAPLYIPTAAAAQPPSSPPDRGLGPSPMFSDWMRAPIPGGPMVPFAQQPASANATAAPDNAPPRDACGRRRRPDAEQPRAKRPRAEAPGRQGAPCRTSRAAPQASEQKSADHVVTEEPINIAALKDFASRRAADTLVLSGCAATAREGIF